MDWSKFTSLRPDRQRQRLHRRFFVIVLVLMLEFERFRSSTSRSTSTITKRENLRGAESYLPLVALSTHARVVKWQTRTFEGRMPQGMGVQVPPRAPMTSLISTWKSQQKVSSF